MNDRIAQMALEAGAYLDIDYPDTVRHVSITPDQLRNFARLVAEDCANIADNVSTLYWDGEGAQSADHVARDIRERYK